MAGMETVLNMITSLAPPPPPPPHPLALQPPPEIASSSHQRHHQVATVCVTNGTTSSPGPLNSTAATSVVVARTPTTPTMSPVASVTFNTPTTSSNIVTHQQPLMSPTGSGGGREQTQQQPPTPQRSTGRTFFRAPGLEAPDDSNGDFPTNALICPDCGFSCSSKFHYNSHRNTHSKHQCPMCNFETRTEGRLKKHMLQSHKREQRFAHGINLQSPPPPPAPPPTMRQHSPPRDGVGGAEKCLAQQMLSNHHVMPPNSMNSLLNSMLSAGDSSANGTLALESLQSMLNNTNPLAQFSNSTDALLKICTDAIANNGPSEKTYNSPQVGELGHIPLEQLRALTERHTANILTTSTGNFGELQIGSEGGLTEGHHQQQNGTDQNGGELKPDNTPRRSGKPKQYKCKQCQHVSRSKKEQWAHARLHIPKQKQLTCALCDFVTEYKHHLEYHYRNHNGQKPFKCSICDYTCVNKSMLNSHMKSHTPVYQFRCQDCTYQTKYCHSLKMHLKKYNHKRAPGPSGFVDSSDSHGEERPENASSSSIGREDTASFENGAPVGIQSSSEGQLEGALEGMLVTPSQVHHLHQHHHHPLLLQQALLDGNGSMGEDAEMEMASQRLMLQQQLEQMNELIRNAVVNCPHCSFSTGNIDEMNRHLLFHLIATQQQMPAALNNEQHALASIYQRLTAQLQQELIPGGEQHHHQLIPPPLSQHDPHSLLSHALAVVTSASQQSGDNAPMELTMRSVVPQATEAEEQRARQMERNAAESIHQQHHQQLQAQAERQSPQFTSTTVAAMLAAVTQPSGIGVAGGDTMVATLAPTGGDTTMGSTIEGSAPGDSTAGGGTSTTTPTSNGESNNHSQQQQKTASASSTSDLPFSGKMLKREFPFGLSFHHHHPSSAGGNDLMEDSERLHSSAGGSATGTCVITSVMPRLISSIPGLSNGCFESTTNSTTDNGAPGSANVAYNSITGHFPGIQASSGLNMPFFCQQCEIAFRDAALYQVHRGFHARENPFKCNICGHLSCSALDFNLHLYQAKHE